MRMEILREKDTMYMTLQLSTGIPPGMKCSGLHMSALPEN